jgi:DNA adenine methylase
VQHGSKNPLKWVGSKVRIMPQLLDHLPEGKRLVEPFAGSCAVMMNTDYDEYLIADLNPDLVNLYKAMAYHTDAFLMELETLFSAGALGEQESAPFFTMPSGMRSIPPVRDWALKALKPLPVSCT